MARAQRHGYGVGPWPQVVADGLVVASVAKLFELCVQVNGIGVALPSVCPGRACKGPAGWAVVAVGSRATPQGLPRGRIDGPCSHPCVIRGRSPGCRGPGRGARGQWRGVHGYGLRSATAPSPAAVQCPAGHPDRSRVAAGIWCAGVRIVPPRCRGLPQVKAVRSIGQPTLVAAVHTIRRTLTVGARCSDEAGGGPLRLGLGVLRVCWLGHTRVSRHPPPVCSADAERVPATPQPSCFPS